MIAIAAIPAAAIVGLLIVVVWISLHETMTEPRLGLANYLRLYTDPFFYQTIANTAGFAVLATAVAFVFGLPLAWLVERTDLRGKEIVFTFMTLGVLIPSFMSAIGWLLLFQPRVGAANQLLRSLFGGTIGPIDIVSIPGMGFVQGLNLASLVFVMISSSLRALDPSLEESAQMTGASLSASLRQITLPLILPALMGAGIYVLTSGIAAFDVPAVIGLSNRIFTFSTYLYFETHPESGPPQYGLAAAFGAGMIGFALLLGWIYRRSLRTAAHYQVVSGKGYRPRLIPLRRWSVVAWLFIAAYVFLAQLLPLLLLIWAALLPYLRPPSLAALQFVSIRNFQALPWPLVWRGLEHSLLLMIAAPMIAVALSFVFSWVTLRTRARLRFVFDVVAFLPHAVPSSIFAVGALFAVLFVVRWPVDLYGTLSLLLIIYALVYLSFGSRVTNSALVQINPELEESAAISGASTRIVLGRIVAPLLRPAFLYAWLWLVLLTLRELTIASILFSPDNVTLPVVIWNLWNSGATAPAAAATVIMMGALLPIVLVYGRLVGSRAL